LALVKSLAGISGLSRTFREQEENVRVQSFNYSSKECISTIKEFPDILISDKISWLFTGKRSVMQSDGTSEHGMARSVIHGSYARFSMRFYLLTVESSSQSEVGLQVLPHIPLHSLGEHAPGLLMPMAGDELELRLPDGRVQHALVGHFGIEMWRHEDGHFYTLSDPSNPSVTLAIALAASTPRMSLRAPRFG
jgi:hypothetical protein